MGGSLMKRHPQFNGQRTVGQWKNRDFVALPFVGQLNRRVVISVGYSPRMADFRFCCKTSVKPKPIVLHGR
jgi:hypothetical protein